MNYHAPISIEQQLRDAHKDRQTRFAVAAYRHAGKPKSAPAVKCEANNTTSLVAEKPSVQHGAHIVAWRVWRAKLMHHAREYKKFRSIELGYDDDAILVKSRNRKLVEARQLLIWEIKAIVRPDISWMELGRMFRSDHSTIIHAVRRVNELKMKEMANG